MKMKKILNEWKSFVNESAKYDKTPSEKEIEQKAAEMNMKYDEDLANIKAAAHAIHFLTGGEWSNQEQYLTRVEFGLTGAQRIIKLYNDSSLFSEYFVAFVVEAPPVDRRFGDVKKLKGVKIIDRWTRDNLGNTNSVFAKGENEESAYEDLFNRFETLSDMLKSGDYNFRNTFGRVSGSRTSDKRHSGGAFDTGLIVIPTEASDKDRAYIGDKYTFYMKHRNDPAYIMAELAEENLQKALERTLSLWNQYPLKDGEEKQAYTGALIRMEKALKQSKRDLQRIKSDPSSYQSSMSLDKTDMSDEERAEDLLTKAKSGDKKAAGEAFKLFRKLKNNLKAREARNLMR